MLPLILVIILHHLSFIHCVEVTPSSQCSSICLNSPTANVTDKLASSTQPYQLVCNDWELSGPNSTADGRKFHDCLACESSSTASDQGSRENDVYWFLFNMKYTIDHCVFSFENNNITIQNLQCADTCAGPSNSMLSAMTDRVLQTNTTIQYQYCEDGNGAFQKNVNACMDCLRKVPASNTLVNYLRALDQGCDQKPPIGGSTPLKLDFDIFNTTAPPSTTSSSPAAITITSAPHTPTLNSSSNSHNVALGAGLGLGLGIPLLCLLGLLIYLLRRQRAQRQYPSSEMQPVPPGVPRSQNNHGRRAEMHGSPSFRDYHEVDNNNNNKDIPIPPAVPEKDHWSNTTKSATSPARTSKSERSSRRSRGGSVQELTGSTAAMHEMPSKGSLREVHHPPSKTSPRLEEEERRIHDGATTAGSKTTVGTWAWKGPQ